MLLDAGAHNSGRLCGKRWLEHPNKDVALLAWIKNFECRASYSVSAHLATLHNATIPLILADVILPVATGVFSESWRTADWKWGWFWRRYSTRWRW